MATPTCSGSRCRMEAPVRASYLSVNPLIFPPVPLAFVPDTNVKGRYTVEAASSASVKTQSIDVLAPVPD